MAKGSITAAGTTTLQLTAGKRYVFGLAGDHDSGTTTIKWGDGTTDVEITNFANADGATEFVTPTGIFKMVHVGGGGSPVLNYVVAPVLIGAR